MLSIIHLFESSRYFKLIPLDKKFHKTIKMDKRFDIADKFDLPYSWWWTVLIDNKKAATVGVILRGKESVKHYFQIAIHQDFRGKGLLSICADLMFKKFSKAKELLSVIHKDNIASEKAHKKAGFKFVNEKNPLIRKDSNLFIKKR